MPLDYFPCYHSYMKKLQRLSDQEVGRLFRALLTYSATGEAQELTGRESMAYDFIVDDIDRAKANYEKKSTQNRANRIGTNDNDRQRTSSNDNDRQRPITNDDDRAQSKSKSKSKSKSESNLSPLNPPSGGPVRDRLEKLRRMEAEKFEA